MYISIICDHFILIEVMIDYNFTILKDPIACVIMIVVIVEIVCNTNGRVYSRMLETIDLYCLCGFILSLTRN